MNTIENKIPFTTISPVPTEEHSKEIIEHDKKSSHGSKTREKLLKKIKRANDIKEMMTFSKLR